MALTLPIRWQGCEHVVTCLTCLGDGCRACGKRGVRWNRQTLPANMLLRGYSVRNGVCYWTGQGMTTGVVMSELSVCANIEHLDGEAVEVTPVDLSLLDGVPVSMGFVMGDVA